MRAALAFALLAALAGGCLQDRVASESQASVQSLALDDAPAPPAAPADRAVGGLLTAVKMEASSGAGRDALQGVARPTVLSAPMLIRTGTMAIEVDSVELAVSRATAIAEQVGGFVANASLQTGEHARRSAVVEIKVPSARYEGAIGQLHEVGEVRSVQSSSEDVSEEFVDVTARVANARRLEERLVTVLATRTGKLEEVLAVERELARVREEIERYQGRLRYLEAKAAMSSITLQLFEPVPLVGEPGSNVIVEALRQSWRNFVQVVAGGIAAAGSLLPVALVLGAIGLGLRRRWRRREAAEAGA